MCRPQAMSASANRPRSVALPPAPPLVHTLRRKYSLDHASTPWRAPTPGGQEMTEAAAGTSAAELDNSNKEENQNMPSETQVLNTVDNYFYDFDHSQTTSETQGARVRRNLNVRPRSWVTSTSSTREDTRRRRQTDPGRDFLSNYERALSTLLYQPYECRNEEWVENYRNYSSSSSSTSTSSLGDLVRRWSSTQSGALGNAAERCGNPAPISDPDPAPTGSAQSASRHGSAMLVTVGEEECYRAVPATVDTVPNIQCNVSNVRVNVQRTFTSTEAQTDDVVDTRSTRDREQRRRERRERRHQRRLANHLHPPIPPAEVWHTPVPEPGADRLPDILNSHLPPPYSTLPLGLTPLPPVPPVVTTVGASPQGLRFPFAIVPVRRRSPHFASEDQPKSCCGVAVSQTLTVRWFIILIFLVGLCCAIVGTVLGAMKATGREHLTVSLLMIGVGIVLVAVSGVAWRLTSQQAPSCRAMLGLGGDDTGGEPNRRFVPRLPPSYGRPHHPYAAMMYPEFQYRAPPPSYQASMQEYRLRLLLLDRHSGTVPGNTVSPPPTYRSQAGSLLRAPIGLRGRETCTPSQSEYSRPPSYRSRTSSRPDPSITHSREPSGSEVGQAVNVITVHPHIIKLAPSPPLPAKGGKDSNMVTIVQTASQPTGPVIVTISGQDDGSTSHCQQSEMEILAHL